MSDEIKKEITVVFVTKLPEEFKVPDAPIVIPTSMGSKELSEMISSMLEIDLKRFEFLANGVLIRPTIEAYLESHNISTEHTLELEYVFGIESEKEEEINQHKDWISSIVVHGSNVVSGSYDGIVRLYPGEQETFVSKAGVMAIDISSEGVMAVGCKDGYVYFFANKTASAPYKKHHAIRNASVESIKFSADGALVAVGGFNGKIAILNTPENKPAAKSSSVESDPSQPKKRSRADVKDEKVAAAEEDSSYVIERCVLSNHTKPVRGLKWTSRGDLFSCSEDQTVRLWEIASVSEVAIMPVSAPCMSMDVSADGKTVVTGHDDGRLRVWALKGTESHETLPNLILKRSYLAHKRLIRAVAFHPSNSFIVASVALDGAVRVFDVRAEALPIQVIHFPPENQWRGLACKWQRAADDEMTEESEANKISKLVTGGSDGIVRVHGFRGLQY